MNEIHHFVDGTVVPSTSGRTAAVFDPATGRQQAEVALASVAEVDAAVASSSAAFSTWRSSSLSARTSVLFKFRELLDARRTDLAKSVSAEHGKVPSDAMGEIARGMENIEFACGFASLLK